VAAAEPAAAVTITMFEYGFTVDGTLAAGPQVIKVTNVGAQPHFTLLDRSPASITKEQVGQLLELDMSGATPAPDSGLPSPDEFVPVAYAGTISMGVTEWVTADIQPGTHVLLCFIPEIGTGIPHAIQGMYEVVTVGG